MEFIEQTASLPNWSPTEGKHRESQLTGAETHQHCEKQCKWRHFKTELELPLQRNCLACVTPQPLECQNWAK